MLSPSCVNSYLLNPIPHAIPPKNKVALGLVNGRLTWIDLSDRALRADHPASAPRAFADLAV